MTARLNNQSEVYTVTLSLDFGTSPKGKWCVCEENCILKQCRETGRMCVSAFVCVCLSACDHSSVSECTRVCMLSSVTACVLFRCVYRGIPLQGRWRGAWPLGHSSNTETHLFPSAHSGRCRSLPLKVNERSLNNRRRQVISLSKY